MIQKNTVSKISLLQPSIIPKISPTGRIASPHQLKVRWDKAVTRMSTDRFRCMNSCDQKNMPKKKSFTSSPSILRNRIYTVYKYIYIYEALSKFLAGLIVGKSYSIHTQKLPTCLKPLDEIPPKNRPPTCVHISQRPNGPSSMPLHTSEFC